MKKGLTFIVLIATVFLVSCFGYNNSYGSVEDIKIYTKENIEVAGQFYNMYSSEYLDFIGESYEKTRQSKNKPNRTKLNSPAPVELIYGVEITEFKEYLVEIKFKVINNYEVNSISFDSYTISKEDFYSVEDKDGYIYIRLNIVVTEDSYEFQHLSFNLNHVYKDVIQKGTTKFSSRNYYNGVYFKIA